MFAGNPLVDSVAEHQPANEQAYQQYLHHAYDLAPYGLVLSLLPMQWTDGNVFMVLYACTAYFFANKMARLIILLGPGAPTNRPAALSTALPIDARHDLASDRCATVLPFAAVASGLGGIAIGLMVDQLLLNSTGSLVKHFFNCNAAEDQPEEEEKEEEDKVEEKTGIDKALAPLTDKVEMVYGAASKGYRAVHKTTVSIYDKPALCMLRIAIGIYLLRECYPKAVEFYDYSHQLADGLSQPSIMFKAKLNDGTSIIVDDYREAYHWLRDNTPEDSRVMAWWDYGYQITGIGERTTIADGNTWNHEHIATLGRILSAPQEKAHRIARHLADYVLVWAGGGGDDLAKSPHMARIGNSVFRDICPNDPTCSQFGFYQGGKPTPMMENCLLYKMCLYGQQGVSLNNSLFSHVFSSKYRKVRIFKVRHVSKKSKDWVANPDNKICDAPGSWYCTGQYPPALAPLIAKRHNFAQVEDFNAKKTDHDKKYNEEYMRRMAGGGPSPPPEDEPDEAPAPPKDYGVKFVGCFGKEDQLGEDKEYGGGAYGANIGMAARFAREKKKKYLAIARVGQDGHNFAFDDGSNLGGEKMDDEGCNKECADGGHYACGCADAACGYGVEPAEGEEMVRRWAVYEVQDKKKKKKKKKEL